MNKIIKEKLKEAIILFIIVITFGCILLIMLKYENEGEKNLPFNLSEMLVISSVDELQKQENPDNMKWNLDINQYNDIYLKIEKNPDFQENAYIESITIENINIKTNEQNQVNVFMPNSTDGKLFSYEDNFIVTSRLTYNGASQDNNKTLEIGNQGGRILFRIVNQGIGEYVSNDEGEIAYDGTLLKTIGVPDERINMDVSFDLLIKTNLSNYRGKVNLKLPCGEIMEEGICKLEKTDFSNVAFKREK